MKKCSNCLSLKIEETEFSLPDRRHFHCIDCGNLFSETVKQSRQHSKLKASIHIKVIDFYLIAKSNEGLQGTLHVLLADLGANLRGIQVNKNGASWYFALPWGSTRDCDGDNHVRYPIFSFTDSAKNQALRSLISEKGKEFIEEKYLNKKQTRGGGL